MDDAERLLERLVGAGSFLQEIPWDTALESCDEYISVITASMEKLDSLEVGKAELKQQLQKAQTYVNGLNHDCRCGASWWGYNRCGGDWHGWCGNHITHSCLCNRGGSWSCYGHQRDCKTAGRAGKWTSTNACRDEVNRKIHHSTEQNIEHRAVKLEASQA